MRLFSNNTKGYTWRFKGNRRAGPNQNYLNMVVYYLAAKLIKSKQKSRYVFLNNDLTGNL